MLVFLTGYRGSGKTTVGRLLAERLGVAFVDLDERITSMAGQTIREIFAAEGEAGFRQRESAALCEAVKQQNAVIALGGGALLLETNRAMIPKDRSAVVYLRADAEVLHTRIYSDPTTAAQRPALTALGGTLEEIRQLLTDRDPHYRNIMTHEIDVTTLCPEDIANRLHQLVGLQR